jgi:hypothetical protein
MVMYHRKTQPPTSDAGGMNGDAGRWEIPLLPEGAPAGNADVLASAGWVGE